MINKKDLITKENPPIFTKNDFLRVLDRAIKPPYQETDLLLVTKGYSPNRI